MNDPVELMERYAAELGEHFGAVQILCSQPADGGGTRGIMRGCGDWYARQGLAHAFINEDVAAENGRAVAASLENGE